MKYKYIILGAGPAGLTFANLLFQNGEESFLVIEKESEAGGLCRSKEVDGAPLDIGGGHFLDVNNAKVCDFLFQYMPENEWTKFERNSKIHIHNTYIDHPMEANIWQLPIDLQIEYLKSIFKAGCNQEQGMPSKFVDWIEWKLGDRIAEDYMIPYNQKMFSSELNELGTYWLEKLPNVSFDDTLRSCLEHKAYAKQPGHAQFYYPQKYGYGEVWKRMADVISDHIVYNLQVDGIDLIQRSVSAGGRKFCAEKIITTIPWKEFRYINGMSLEMIDSIKKLKNNSIYIEYRSDSHESNAHWVYYPDLSIDYHRILVRKNFCEGSRGYWTETNAERYSNYEGSQAFYCEYAYPLNTIDKPVIMKVLMNYMNQKGVYPLGRWGEHQHYNSDVTVEKAMELYQRVCKE